MRPSNEALRLGAPGMGGRAHLAHRLKKSVQHSVGYEIIDPFWEPARRLLGDLANDEGAIVRQRRLAVFEPLFEQGLRGALRPQDRQRARGERRGGDRRDAAPRRFGDEFAEAIRRELGDRLRQKPARPAGDPFGVFLVADPAREDQQRVDAGEPLARHPGRQEVVGDEAAERRADPLLVGRNDRRMGDRQPERPAEQRHDGEPVGASADHAGLGEGAQVRQPRPSRMRRARREKDRGHRGQKRRRDRSHAPEVDELLLRALAGRREDRRGMGDVAVRHRRKGLHGSSADRSAPRLS